MISFNTKDYNVGKIKTESKLGNLQTSFSYRVYGLRQEHNPVVEVSYKNAADCEELDEICEFFDKNGIQVVLDNNNNQEYDYYIGMRKDFRNHVLLAASVLQTIIYALEKRVKLNKKFKIAGIPKFN